MVESNAGSNTTVVQHEIPYSMNPVIYIYMYIHYYSHMCHMSRNMWIYFSPVALQEGATVAIVSSPYPKHCRVLGHQVTVWS